MTVKHSDTRGLRAVTDSGLMPAEPRDTPLTVFQKGPDATKESNRSAFPFTRVVATAVWDVVRSTADRIFAAKRARWADSP